MGVMGVMGGGRCEPHGQLWEVRAARAVMGIVGGVSYKVVLVGVSGISFFREAICSSFSLSCFS